MIDGDTLMSLEDSPVGQADVLDEQISRPASRAEEKELYADIYERLYPLLQGGQINYAALAGQTGLPEPRIREALLYRLSGEVPQLAGHSKGTCYVCQDHLQWRDNTEPVCLACLDKLDQALEQDGQYEFLALDAQTGPVDDRKLGAGAHDITENDPQVGSTVVPRSEYDKVLRELELYRQLYGALATEPEEEPVAMPSQEFIRHYPGKADASLADATANPELPGEPPLGEPHGSIEFLSILSVPDDEILLCDLPEPPGGETLRSTESLRHYGFKKLRGRI